MTFHSVTMLRASFAVQGMALSAGGAACAGAGCQCLRMGRWSRMKTPQCCPFSLFPRRLGLSSEGELANSAPLS